MTRSLRLGRLWRRTLGNSPSASDPSVELGHGTYGAVEVLRYPGEPMTRVTIGNYCAIGAETRFLAGGNHDTAWTSSYPFRARYGLPGALIDGVPGSRGDIVVGSDVWIGREAMILSGVTIGDGAVVGARAVVARDVRPYAVVVGNPAREVRRRFDDATVEALILTRWWDWPEAELLGIVDLLNGAAAADLIAYAERRAK